MVDGLIGMRGRWTGICPKATDLNASEGADPEGFHLYLYTRLAVRETAEPMESSDYHFSNANSWLVTETIDCNLGLHNNVEDQGVTDGHHH
jgi:hypothetical protein